MTKQRNLSRSEITIIVDQFILAQDLDELKKCLSVKILFGGIPISFKYLLQAKLIYQGCDISHIIVNNGDQEKTKYVRDMLDKLNEDFIGSVLLKYRLGVLK